MPLSTSQARCDILKQLDKRGLIAPAEHVASMSIRFGYAVEGQNNLLWDSLRRGQRKASHLMTSYEVNSS